MADFKQIPVEEEIERALKTSKKSFSKETLDALTALLKKIDEKCPQKPQLALKPVRAVGLSVFDSKLGGVPYLPKDMEYPRALQGVFAGKPLKLLAQINFEKLPHLEGFPHKGILQFFAGCDGDDVYGVDFEDGLQQNGFRILYHENIISDISKLTAKEDMPKFYGDECDYPFTGEFLLEPGECGFKPITPEDYRFDDAAAQCYNELFDGDVVGMWKKDGKEGIRQVNEELYDAIYAVRATLGSGLGGYPFFMQEDPRPYSEAYATCDTLLFQLDSECDGDWKDGIMWGDSGVGNFFISAEDLAKCDFSKVLYTWDCG